VALDRYVLPRYQRRQLAAITQLDVREWVAELSARGLAPATVQKAFQVFAKVMASAIDAGYIAQTPARRIPLPKVEREEMRFLTPKQVAALADVIDPRHRALVFVGAYGGLRIGALAGLRRRHVDMLRGVVEELANHLARYTGPGADAFVFPAPLGGPLRATAFRSRVWRPAVEAAGLDGLRIHDLRHTAVAL
jgi:integrase